MNANNTLTDFRRAGHDYPPEWSNLRSIVGTVYYRVTHANCRTMREYGIHAVHGWYYVRSVFMGTLTGGPFRTLALARAAVWDHMGRER